MTTQTRPQHRTHGIFNDKAEGFTPQALKFLSTDLMRTLFFARIAQIQLAGTGKSDLLESDIRSSIHDVVEQIRRFDMKIRARLQPENARWLSQELSKDKLLDITNLVELAARVSSDGSDTDYEMFMSMMTTFLDRTIHLQSRKKKLNLKKYKALFRFLTEEMIAETEKGLTAVDYNEESDTLSFKLVQPDAQIPARLA